MMKIANQTTYQKQYEIRLKSSQFSIHDFWLPVLIFGSIGAITWAIRGSAGWGGVDGTVVPGLMWGLLWYFLCFRQGIDARGIVFWLGMGLALGGELGYGQYVSWIQGRFFVGDEIIPISPWIGYVWFGICGIGWAAPGGILLGWALGKNVTPRQWLVRTLLLGVLLVLLFAWPFIDWLSAQLARIWPYLLFPHADSGLYTGALDKHLARTVYTNTQNFAVLLWWGLALLVTVFQKDRVTRFTGLVLGGGFGLGFLQSAVWCLGYSSAPKFIDWWKMWELNAGFNLGVLYAIVLCWAIRQVDSHQTSVPDSPVCTRKTEWRNTIFLAISGTILLFFMSFEYFFLTGIFLIVFYGLAIFFPMLTSTEKSDSGEIRHRRDQILLIFSAFLLVFLLLHGGSERAGIFLGLYPAEAVDQYAWPLARILLFLPFALLVFGVALFKIWQIARASVGTNLKTVLLSERMVDLMTFTGFIGALSIWPAKIGVFYALFLALALFAFTRLNRHSPLQRFN